METLNPILAKLIDHFRRLPGIGRKTAVKLAFHVLAMSDAEANDFAETIIAAKEKIMLCSLCQNISSAELCPICENNARDRATIMVLEEPRDVVTMERLREYDGVYHVLHGTIAPMDGIGPDDLKLRELISRMDEGVAEVIMALNPTVNGDATALYISRLLKPLGVKVTRIAYGIPVGGDIEYTDDVTLLRAFEGRREL